MTLQLFHFHSSSTSFRVRIALNLKGLDVDETHIELRWRDGDHETAEYLALNPQANVPVLVHDGHRLTQSLAICDYLENAFPSPPLLPADPASRAWVWSMSLCVACEIQPLCNLRVERFLAEDGADQARARHWRRHWQTTGLATLERMLLEHSPSGRFCHGDTPTLADCVVVPQIYNARRPAVGLDIERWPRVAKVYQACMELSEFQAALPERQRDYQSLETH